MAMNPEAQRVAVAGICGWTMTGKVTSTRGRVTWHGRDPYRPGWGSLPDHPGDLNAMHQAERKLAGPEAWRTCLRHLADAAGFECCEADPPADTLHDFRIRVCHAGAAERSCPPSTGGRRTFQTRKGANIRMTPFTTTRYELIIDTDRPTLDFYQELCAFLTGQTGDECSGRADRIAAAFKRDCRDLDGVPDFGNWVELHPVDQGELAWEPGEPRNTHGRFSDGFGGVHPDTPEGEAAAWKAQSEGLLRRLADDLQRHQSYVDQGEWRPELAKEFSLKLQRQTDLKLLGGLRKEPVRHSVAVFLRREPADWELDWLVGRLKQATAADLGLSLEDDLPRWLSVRVVRVDQTGTTLKAVTP